MGEKMLQQEPLLVQFSEHHPEYIKTLELLKIREHIHIQEAIMLQVKTMSKYWGKIMYEKKQNKTQQYSIYNKLNILLLFL